MDTQKINSQAARLEAAPQADREAAKAVIDALTHDAQTLVEAVLWWVEDLYGVLE